MPVTATQLSNALTDYLAGRSEAQVARSSVLLGLLMITGGAGPNVMWGVEGGTNDSDVYIDAEDIDAAASESDVRPQAALQWAIYGGPVQVGDQAADIAEKLSAGNAPDQIRGRLGLILDEIRIRNQKTGERLGLDLYTATGTRGGKPTLVGLAEIAKNGDSDTYGGLTPSTYTWWRGLVDTTGGAITQTKVQNFFQSFVKDGGCGSKPMIAVTNPDLWIVLKRSVEGTTRVQVNVVANVSINGGNYALPGGATAFYVDGVLVVQDKNCPAGSLFAWADGALELVRLPAAEEAQPGMSMKALAAEIFGNVELDPKDFGSAAQPNRLPAQVKFLAKTGLATKLWSGVTLQLRCRRRNAVGKMTGLTVS